MTTAYRTLFVGTLVQESFLSAGGTDDPFTTVDSPFCRDGAERPTLRGRGLAGALIATLRRLNNNAVPATISGSDQGRQTSVWRFFNSHPSQDSKPAFRQHVAIDARTGAAADGALFNVETLPPGTRWPFLLEVDTAQYAEAADLARDTLRHWLAGRCLLGREVARGMGWMRLDGLTEYTLTTTQIDQWPCSKESENYPAYIAKMFGPGEILTPAEAPLPGWSEYSGTIKVGPDTDTYGLDSLSIGGHAGEELAAAWDHRFLAPDGMDPDAAKKAFDPDFAVVTLERGGKRLPYVPGSSLRGPLRHALERLLKARGKNTGLAEDLFGTVKSSAKLLIGDALPSGDSEQQLAWFQHHAEDEFAGGAYESAKFDRVAVTQGSFRWKMVLEDATEEEVVALEQVFDLARSGQIGIGGGQWRGHGWLRWDIKGCENEGGRPNER